MRTIYALDVVREGDMIRIRVQGNGFLYNMVRIIVGTMAAVGQGKLTPEDIPEITAARDRSRAGITAPPHGLYLHDVKY